MAPISGMCADLPTHDTVYDLEHLFLASREGRRRGQGAAVRQRGADLARPLAQLVGDHPVHVTGGRGPAGRVSHTRVCSLLRVTMPPWSFVLSLFFIAMGTLQSCDSCCHIVTARVPCQDKLYRSCLNLSTVPAPFFKRIATGTRICIILHHEYPRMTVKC